MTDAIIANLPSADFEATEAFYAALGFARRHRDRRWLVLARGAVSLEFFAATLDPSKSWFSATFRVDDLDAWYAQCAAMGLPDEVGAIPRCGTPKVEESGLRLFYVVDPDGSLIRVIDNNYKP